MPLKDPSRDQLRKTLRSGRRALSARDVIQGSQRIVRNILGYLPFTEFGIIALYWPVGNEVDVRALASFEPLTDHTFALPVIEGKEQPLGFRSWKPGDPMEKGPWGEMVPTAGAAVDPQLVLAPLLGFDRMGNRLGQGGGYYDRTLARLRQSGEILAVGLAFSMQECLNVPNNEHDEPLDRVVTELEVISF